MHSRMAAHLLNGLLLGGVLSCNFLAPRLLCQLLCRKLLPNSQSLRRLFKCFVAMPDKLA